MGFWFYHHLLLLFLPLLLAWHSKTSSCKDQKDIRGDDKEAFIVPLRKIVSKQTRNTVTMIVPTVIHLTPLGLNQSNHRLKHTSDTISVQYSVTSKHASQSQSNIIRGSQSIGWWKSRIWRIFQRIKKLSFIIFDCRGNNNLW